MKNYNTTQLSPEQTFERHVFHRDQFAHYLRWSYVLNTVVDGSKIVDFGCGSGSLLEVLYRNRMRPQSYVGLDIRKNTVFAAGEKYKNVDWAHFIYDDLVKPVTDLSSLNGNITCSFEVLEHVGKCNADVFLQNMIKCGPTGMFLISTPNYDPEVGAADNHTYDSGNGNGEMVQEFTHQELTELFAKYFIVDKKYGTFASIRDYKPLMNEWQTKMFEGLREYYDTNLLSNIMAPFFPEQARNTLWVMRAK
jgi:2-polyprenyl-3-methyl-5-hydroxy-6-metoxy-1,4-benzoquinol methylase